LDLTEALTRAHIDSARALEFKEAIRLVRKRGQFMQGRFRSEWERWQQFCGFRKASWMSAGWFVRR
jgi:hypothetical protein